MEMELASSKLLAKVQLSASLVRLTLNSARGRV